MARKYNLNEKTLNGYLQIIKTIVDDIAFEHYPRASKKTPNGYYQWRSTYILSEGDTVNNLFFTLKSMRNIDYEYHSFMLSYRHNGVENIICQLEVYPDDELSHREPDGSPIFGPHIHLIDRVEEARPPNYNNLTWYEWLVYYINEVKIVLTGHYTAAFDGELELWMY